MKKYIYKILLFLLPILLLSLITEIFYKPEQGDLIRLGYLFDIGDYRSNIDKELIKLPLKFNNISRINLDLDNEYKVMTIGDSFSEQGELGYQNYLANEDDISTIHIDRYLVDNPLQTLINFVNADVFEKINVDFVVLQSAERYFVQRNKDINYTGITPLDSIKNKIEKRTTTLLEKTINSNCKLFSDKIIKAPFVNFLFLFNDKPYKSKTYKVKTTINYFTNKSKKILFYEKDLDNVKVNNDSLSIVALNNTLNFINNKLNAKGIKLIVLTCPDKYDVYYESIIEKNKYTKPLFFDYFNKLQKSYYCINSKEIIQKLIKETKDVYYYGDTHWTPIAAEKIGQEIGGIVKSDSKKSNYTLNR